jgi:hypothetical protein
MRVATLRRLLWLAPALLLAAAPLFAESEIGTVAAVQGAVQLERAGATQTAAIGVPLVVGDRLRTSASDRVRVVFDDDSVLEVGPESDLVVDTWVFDKSANRFKALLKLRNGTILTSVSDYYRAPRATFEIETPTAVVGVRGTEFITRYYPTAEVTEVVGLVGEVNVSGRLAVIGAGVQVGPQEYTQVRKGGFPTTPERLNEARYQQYVESVELLGTGRRDGLNVLHPLMAGRLVSPDDTPQGAVGAEVAGVGAPPGFLANRLSQDVYTNTQPLLDYENTPPGQVPPGSVTVHY